MNVWWNAKSRRKPGPRDAEAGDVEVSGPGAPVVDRQLMHSHDDTPSPAGTATPATAKTTDRQLTEPWWDLICKLRGRPAGRPSRQPPGAEPDPQGGSPLFGAQGGEGIDAGYRVCVGICDDEGARGFYGNVPGTS